MRPFGPLKVVGSAFARRLERRNAELVGLLKRARQSVSLARTVSRSDDNFKMAAHWTEVLTAIDAATQSAKGGEGEE